MSDSPACSGTNLFPPKWRFHRDRGKESYPFILRIFWHRELVQKIATMVENIEKLKKEKALLLKQFLCSSLKRAYRLLDPVGPVVLMRYGEQKRPSYRSADRR